MTLNQYYALEFAIASVLLLHSFGVDSASETYPELKLPASVKTPGEWSDNTPMVTTLQPYFTSNNNTEVSTQVGSVAVLHCAAEDVGENTVSWVRRRDYHLLTVGQTQYSNDQRIQLLYIEKENNWQLHIRYAQKHDEGIYECQVSSHPPMILITTLRVAEATSEILGGPEKYLTIGSSLRLVCILKKNTQPPSYVFWYLNNRMINYDSRVKVEVDGEVSVLFLNNLQPDSSGNYSCVPSNAKPSRINIQILRGGEMPAAIQSGSSTYLPTIALLGACLAIEPIYSIVSLTSLTGNPFIMLSKLYSELLNISDSLYSKYIFPDYE